jgi:putative ABC transport system permease protein
MKRILRWALGLFPNSFRERYEDELYQALLLKTRVVRERHGLAGALRMWRFQLFDLLRSAWSERAAEYSQKERKAHVIVGLFRDIRLSFRKLAKIPGFFFTTTSILALGIGATVTMFSILDAALSRASAFPNPEELILGRATFEGEINPTVSFLDYLDYRDGTEAFQSLALVRNGFQSHTITGAREPERIPGQWVSVDLFSTLRVTPQTGRGFIMEEAGAGAPPVGIISHRFCQRHFGGISEAVGRSLVVDGSPLTVVGVMPASFRFHQDVDLWLPIREGILDSDMRDSHSWLIVGRMRTGVSIEEAQLQVEVVARRLAQTYSSTHATKSLLLTRLDSALAEPYRPTLLLLMAATSLILLVACGNVAGLLLAKNSARRSEFALCVALGASGKQVGRQLLTESLVMALVGGAAGTLLALWLRGLVLRYLPVGVIAEQGLGLSAPALVFALAVSLGTALVFGAGPAVTGTRADPARDLVGGHRTSAGGRTIGARSILVVLQVALSMVLLSASGLLLRSLSHLQETDLGFRPEGVLTASLPVPTSKYTTGAERTRFFRALLTDLEAIPGVRAASIVNMVPIRHKHQNWGVYDPENPPASNREGISAYARSVLPGYFEVMGIPVVAGRDFQDLDEESAQGLLVINAEMARNLFPGQDPIGRRVAIGSGENPWLREVVGVVGDIRMTTVDQTPFPQMYFHYPGLSYATMHLVVRSNGDPTGLIAPIRQAVLDRDSDIPLTQVATLPEIVSASLSTNRVIGVMITLFAGMALFLSVVGLHGILAFNVSMRTHEIGVRMAIGAGAYRVTQMVLRQGLSLVLAGLLVGFGAALVSTRIFRSLLYQVEPTDPATYVTVTVLFLLAGVLACLLPAKKAARIDPVRSLQAE